MLITRPVLTPPPRAFFPAARLLLHVRTRSHPPTAEHGWNVDKRPRESFCVCAQRDCAERRYALAPRARYNAAGGKKGEPLLDRLCDAAAVAAAVASPFCASSFLLFFRPIGTRDFTAARERKRELDTSNGSALAL